MDLFDFYHSRSSSFIALIFNIGNQYLATDPNGLCSDFNKPIVNDVDSCRKAVSTINKDAPNTLWAGTVTTQFLPKGCQLCMDGTPGCWASSRHENPLYFNNYTDGVRKRGVSQICLESIGIQNYLMFSLLIYL